MKKKLIIVLVVLQLIMVVSFAGNKQLEFVSSSINDGDTEVSMEAEINLEFSNNVTNMKVKDNNISAFSLVNGKGENIDIDVIVPDEQINPELKRMITIKPVNDLVKGESYTLVIDKKLSSKNESTLKENIEINFEVEDEAGFNYMYLLIIGLIIVVIAVMKRRGNEK
ncbi:Ig-like domain-containing protein [Clostridiaceae bacterium HSG29]|nr:Ig-like domain-containing protein [Clostridiaceae bacterium HSG29]